VPNGLHHSGLAPFFVCLLAVLGCSGSVFVGEVVVVAVLVLQPEGSHDAEIRLLGLVLPGLFQRALSLVVVECCGEGVELLAGDVFGLVVVIGVGLLLRPLLTLRQHLDFVDELVVDLGLLLGEFLLAALPGQLLVEEEGLVSLLGFPGLLALPEQTLGLAPHGIKGGYGSADGFAHLVPQPLVEGHCLHLVGVVEQSVRGLDCVDVGDLHLLQHCGPGSPLLLLGDCERTAVVPERWFYLLDNPRQQSAT